MHTFILKIVQRLSSCFWLLGSPVSSKFVREIINSRTVRRESAKRCLFPSESVAYDKFQAS